MQNESLRKGAAFYEELNRQYREKQREKLQITKMIAMKQRQNLIEQKASRFKQFSGKRHGGDGEMTSPSVGDFEDVDTTMKQNFVNTDAKDQSTARASSKKRRNQGVIKPMQNSKKMRKP